MWQTIERRVDSRNMAFFGFWMATLGLVGSLLLSWQDWTMSYYGFQWLEDAFGLKVTTEPWVLIPLAVIPWVTQILLIFLYGLDTSKKWPLYLAALMFLFDMATDVQYRSNANLFTTPNYTVIAPQAGRWTTVAVSAGVTFIFFGVMAEVLFTASIALITGLYEPAIEQWGTMRAAQIRAGKKTKGMIDAAHRGDGGGNNRNNNRNNRPPQGQPQRERPPQSHGAPPMPRINMGAPPDLAAMMAALDSED
jgi:hypothetical protein